MNKIAKKNAGKAILYVMLVFVMFVTVTILTTADSVHIDERSELYSFDFSSRVAVLPPHLFDMYPNLLLTSEDFAAADTADMRSPSGSSDFATYRILLPLEEGVIY